MAVALLFALSILGPPALADTFVGTVDDEVINRVEALLAVPEDNIDFARAKLLVDQIIDPDMDVAYQTERLDRMVRDIEAMGPFASSVAKLAALRRYIYEPGAWNRFRPFTYDFDDPKGANVQNKLIGNYLDSRKGNCVSMPLLFAILGQRLGLDMTVSTAPLHVFVKFTDDATGITYNLETTSGGHPARDSWLRKGFPMTDLAIRNGVYLKKLSRRETVAVMADTLLQHFAAQGRFAQVVALADVILVHRPTAVNAIVYKSYAYNELLKRHGLWRFREVSDVPEAQRPLFRYLVSRVEFHHRQAVELGWLQPG